ncbi:cysteine proteinases superfamily protein [Striga asiatica]|uniref:Ubiquitin thioesterase OTU n=1 Tax=Striga asiatica TaxID=4170 RepID=A0A5A7R1T1_STRAF|nr:cysteine proteinases superfamily protein [Striga asiatica]
MLGVFCARPRPLPCLFLSALSSCAVAPFHRLLRPSPDAGDLTVPLSLSGRCGPAASVWHTILPSYWRPCQSAVLSRHDHCAVGEGSWNVTWDARPARWLHHPDSAWLLFGVCSTLAAASVPPLANSDPDSNLEPADLSTRDESCNYRVVGVEADGRCLFRAIAHMACLRNGEKAPDEIRQKELADELRAQVVDELLMRRKDVEWCFIEEEFDLYVKRIREPCTWGGEPELLMCSHVLKTPICVFMKGRSSSSLTKIANYGEEYRRDGEKSIDVLFHGYGHYDILEAVSDFRLEGDINLLQ